MSGCCDHVEIVYAVCEVTTPEKFTYNAKIVYCKNCGSLKSTSNIEKT